MKNDKHMTIGFHLVNEFGEGFSQESTIKVFRDLGETDIDAIGRYVNIFLAQCGYVRSNDFIFMEDVTEDELEMLSDALWAYREGISGSLAPAGCEGELSYGCTKGVTQ